MKSIIIQGSSRIDGHTSVIAEHIQSKLNSEIVHLAGKNNGHYDYSFKNAHDDFLPLITNMANNYDLIIFATPVYWYSMSGHMKVFFDRISDCLKTCAETGRKLRGKRMAVISCGSGPSATESFFTPFRLSAEYLGMHYSGELHTWIDDQVTETVLISIHKFCQKLTE